MVQQDLSQAHFSEYIGHLFQMRSDSEIQLNLRLIEAKNLISHEKAQPKSKRSAPFSLVFQGPQDSPLYQSTYQLQHEHLGELPVFLVPIDQDQEGVYYEAIFN